MGLFRSRGRKNRERAAAELLEDELLKEQTTAKAKIEVERREVVAEARPNPDQPGWGRAVGLQIGKARDDKAGQE